MSFRFWFSVLAYGFLLGIVFGMPWLVVFSVTISGMLIIASYWRKHALDALIYTRRWHYTRGFPGESSPVRIEVENRKWLPLSWLQTSDPWPIQAAPIEDEFLAPSHLVDTKCLTNVYSLRWFEKVTREYHILFRQRGVYKVGPTTLRSGDLFGLFEINQIRSHDEYLTVFPEILSLKQLHLPTEDPFGYQASRRRLFEDPTRPIGIRDYAPEDDFRRIHWPATARTGQLQVKVFEPVSSQVLMICLNIATTSQPWLGTAPDLLEQLVRICATLSKQGLDRHFSVGLISNGYLAYSDHPFHIPPGRSPGQLSRLLQTLAAVTPFTSSQFETFLIRSMSQIPYGATLIIVTAVHSSELHETLLRLKKYRSHITLISLSAVAPPDLPGIRVIHLPYMI